MMAAILTIAMTIAPWAQADAPARTGVRVALRTLDAERVDAILLSLSETTADVIINGERRSLSLDDVLRIAPATVDASLAEGLRGDIACYPTAGGVLIGTLTDGAGTGSLRLRMVGGVTVDAPFAAVAAVRFLGLDDAAALADFNSRRADRKPGRDLLLMQSDGRVSAIPGALESITTEGWAFRFADKLRKGNVNQAIGIVLGSAAAPEPRPPVVVSLIGDSALVGHVVGSDPASLTVDAGALGRVTFVWPVVRAVDFESGRVVKLSDLTPVAASNTSVLGGDWPARANRNVAGGPMAIGSQTYSHGWGVHATSRLEFELAGSYERFVADVGIDTSVAPRGSAIFRVIVDGEPRYESETMRGGDAAARVRVELAGGKRLILECGRADQLDLSDYGNWANAQLVRTRERDAD